MTNVILIITSVVFAILIILSSIYFLVYFQDPQDKWVAWFPKIIVILGLSVACYNVLLLPLDVANTDGLVDATQGLPMATLNLVFFMITVVMALVIVPFTIFYYEGSDDSDDENGKDNTNVVAQLIYAFKWMIPTLMIVIGIITPLYIYVGYAEVPTTIIRGTLIKESAEGAFGSFCTNKNIGAALSCSSAENTEKIKVSVVVYIIATTGLIGWILFSIFGGFGLFLLPIDTMVSVKNTISVIKKAMSNSEYLQRKGKLGELAGKLLERGDIILGRKVPSDPKEVKTNKKTLKQFKRDVLLLENSYEELQSAYAASKNRNNPLLLIGQLLFGLFGIIISSMWYLHLLLYVIPDSVGRQPASAFLNEMFRGLTVVPFLGPAIYGVFVFWLLLCTIKGTIALGMRILFIPIHPVKIGNTLMSSLVFNVGLMLFSSLAVVQFCSIAFQEYARYTSVIAIFSTQIQKLAYIRYGFIGFIFIFMLVSFFSLIFAAAKKKINPKVKEINI